MSLKLFTKTCRKDFPWLVLAAKTLGKFCQEDLTWFICVEDEDLKDLKEQMFKAFPESSKKSVVVIHGIDAPWPEARKIPDGYMRQQWIKMNAFRIVENEMVWNWDSDVLAQKDFTRADLVGSLGRPIMWYSVMNDLIVGGYPPGRKASLLEIFGKTCNFEWMRCMPIPMAGGIQRHASTQPEWKRSFDALMRGDRNFSEFNVLGEFSHENFPNSFEWKNAEQEGPTWAGGFQEQSKLFCQQWSWGPIPEEVKGWVNSL